jgi:AAA domain
MTEAEREQLTRELADLSGGGNRNPVLNLLERIEVDAVKALVACCDQYFNAELRSAAASLAEGGLPRIFDLLGGVSASIRDADPGLFFEVERCNQAAAMVLRATEADDSEEQAADALLVFLSTVECLRTEPRGGKRRQDPLTDAMTLFMGRQPLVRPPERADLRKVISARLDERLSALTDRLDQDNRKLRQRDPQILIDALLLEQQLLKDRQLLAGQYGAVAEAVEALKWVSKAEASLRSLPTIQRDVTSKQKALAKELVAQGFITRFTENCTALRLTLPVQFKFAGEAGTTDRKIELANAGMTGVDPSQVLSEGEQTAGALADFLTEVELNGACGGVIFDDPVTSMDHLRKETIAQRLVSEAERRQVIVFTHDILFTNYLAIAAEEKRVAFAGRTVWRDDANSPGAIDRLAFPHEHYEGAAHDRAKDHYELARTLAGDPQRDALEKACGSLRTAYEDFIQKRLFNNVVRRWRENITFTLNQVYFDEAIAGRIHDRMAALSRYIDAHSHSEVFHEVPLTTELVKSELAQFDAIKSDYKKARAEWEKAKPSASSVFS